MTLETTPSAPGFSQVLVNQASYACSGGEGLDGAAVLELDHFIYREGYRLLEAYPHSDLDIEDLLQEGRIGALGAARRFDPTRKVKFLTYAAFSISAAMREAIGRGTIRTPRGARRVSMVYLDAPLQEDEDGSREAFTQLDPYDLGAEAERRDLLARVLACVRQLPERPGAMLLRYAQDESLAAIAKDLGISRQRASQILAECATTIRATLAA